MQIRHVWASKYALWHWNYDTQVISMVKTSSYQHDQGLVYEWSVHIIMAWSLVTRSGFVNWPFDKLLPVCEPIYAFTVSAWKSTVRVPVPTTLHKQSRCLSVPPSCRGAAGWGIHPGTCRRSRSPRIGRHTTTPCWLQLVAVAGPPALVSSWWFQDLSSLQSWLEEPLSEQGCWLQNWLKEPLSEQGHWLQSWLKEPLFG